MPEKVSWTMRLQIEGGPSFQLGQELEPEAYEKLSVTVPKTGETTVDIPSLAKASLLLAQCIKLPAAEKKEIKCTLGDIELDLAVVPLIVIGDTLITKLAASNQLAFTNGYENEVVIDILVCRELPASQE
jgi:hypothetical protein